MLERNARNVFSFAVPSLRMLQRDCLAQARCIAAMTVEAALELPMDADGRAHLTRAAAVRCMSLTEFVLDASLREAERIIVAERALSRVAKQTTRVSMTPDDPPA